MPGMFRVEPLCLSSGQKRKPDVVSSYGGVQFAKPVDKNLFRWLLPGCLWDIEVGLSRQELEEKRSQLPQGREDFKEDTPFTMRPDTPVCRRVQYISGPDADSRDRIVEIHLEGDAQMHLGAFPSANRMVEALVQALGEPRFLKADVGGNSSGGRQFLAHWICGDRSLTLQMNRYFTEVSTRISISETRSTRAAELVMKKRKLAKGAVAAVVGFEKWMQAQDNK